MWSKYLPAQQNYPRQFSDEDETETVSFNEYSSSDASQDTTDSDDSVPDNIFDMQFNELRGLVDEIQETSRYDTSATEDLPENENLDAIANHQEEIAEQVLLDANEEDFDQHKPMKHDRISFFCES